MRIFPGTKQMRIKESKLHSISLIQPWRIQFFFARFSFLLRKISYPLFWSLERNNNNKLQFEVEMIGLGRQSEWNSFVNVSFKLLLVHWTSNKPYQCEMIHGGNSKSLQKRNAIDKFMAHSGWIDDCNADDCMYLSGSFFTMFFKCNVLL